MRRTSRRNMARRWILMLIGVWAVSMKAQGFQPCLPRSHVASISRTKFIMGPLLSSDPGDTAVDFENEEILMRLHFSINDNVDKETAKERLSRYCQSFPFAAILPVQPLQYLPAEDGGVDVRFLRKKTDIKSGIDGGIRFFLFEDRGGLEIVAKRNSKGQRISKIFSEKTMVQSFIKRVTGEEIEKTSPAPTDVVSISSIFHKWM